LVALALTMMSPRRGQAQGGGDDAFRISTGFAIAPVPLNLTGKDPNLVGLGSYLVNGANDCNFCHTSGGPPNVNFLAGHNPYFLSQGPKQTNPATYLAGGTDFGPAVFPSPYPPGSVPPTYPPPGYGTYIGPDIIARNLTPNGNGLPEGGHSLTQFMTILRTGVDMDHVHPTCTASSPSPTPANCIPPPVNGDVLQVMPWPDFQSMTDYDLQAIWTYLSAIPCIDNKTSTPPAGAPTELRNNCGH
jgi:hypothetical protein